jgi:hypothetical protein
MIFVLPPRSFLDTPILSTSLGLGNAYGLFAFALFGRYFGRPPVRLEPEGCKRAKTLASSEMESAAVDINTNINDCIFIRPGKHVGHCFWIRQITLHVM